ncbi:MAG: hypothetical protein NTW55_07955, partial [Planctomycetota bacterium]|nr:hypothetical protein [Planctomycetota bacterium]
MENEKDKKNKPQRKTGKRILAVVLILLAVLILLVLIFVPVYVSSEQGRKTILAKINSSVSGKTNFSGLSMSWFRGVKVTGISYKDNAGSTSVEVKQIATKPMYSSILMGSLSLGKTVVDEPRIEVNLDGSKEGRISQGTGGKSTSAGLPVNKIDLVVNNGNVKVTSKKSGTVELSQINSEVNFSGIGEKTSFDVNMDVAGDGKESSIHAKGQVKSDGWKLKDTSGTVTVEVNDLDVASLGPVFELAGVEAGAKGIISANMQGEIKDGQVENLVGTINGKNLDMAIPGTKGDRLKTSMLNVDTKLQTQKDKIKIDKLDVKSDWLDVQASGVVPVTVKSFADFMQPDSPYSLKGNFKCDLALAFTQMPGIFKLKQGTTVTSGSVSGNIETISEGGQRKIAGQANLENLQGLVDDKAVSLSQPVTAQVQMSSDKSGIKYDKLDLSASFAKISCSGTSEQMNYKAQVNLASLQSELGQFVNIGQYNLAGEMTADGKISGDKDKIAIAGTSNFKNLAMTPKSGPGVLEPDADINYSIVVEPAKNVINVSSLDVTASFGHVSTKDAVVPLDSKKAAKAMNLPVSVNNLDLAKLQPFAIMFASFPAKMQMAGLVESQAVITSEKDMYHVVTDSTKISNFRLVSPGMQPFEQSEIVLSLDAEFNPTEKTISNVKKLQLTSPQIKINTNFEQATQNGTTKLNGQADLEYDWAAVSSMVSAYLPQGLKMTGKRKDTINFSSQYPANDPNGLLANLNTKGKLGFDSAQYLGMNFGPTEVDIQAQKGIMTIAPFTAKVNSGQVSFSGSADFNKKPSLLQTPGQMQLVKDVKINDIMSQAVLKNVNPLFANTLNVDCLARFNCEKLAIPLAGANKNDLEVIGTISIDKVTMQSSNLLGILTQALNILGGGTGGQQITVHPTRFVLQKGFLQYDNMQVDLGTAPLIFKGKIG